MVYSDYSTYSNNTLHGIEVRSSKEMIGKWELLSLAMILSNEKICVIYIMHMNEWKSSVVLSLHHMQWAKQIFG